MMLFRKALLAAALLQVASELHAAQLEEVIVTAQKRAQSLQDVPIAVSAFDADFLQGINADRIDDLGKYTPGLNMQNSTTGEPNIFIRGIGSNDFGVGGDISVGVFIDDVYVGRISGAVFDISDAERVEVLKGPQGTLFGRNTIGGAISITSRRPGDELAGNLAAEIGSYDKRRLQGSVDVPLSEDWAVRLSALKNERDGHIKNDFDGEYLEDENNSNGKMTLVYTPGDTFEGMFKLAYDDTDVIARTARSSNPDYLGGDPWDNAYSDLGADAVEDRILKDASLHLGWDWDAYSFKSITAYRGTDYRSRKDSTGTGSRDALLRTNIWMDAEQYSQEFRLNFDNGGDFLWFAGASVFKENVEQSSLLESTNETVKSIASVTPPYDSLLQIPFVLAAFEAAFPDGGNYYETLVNGGEYLSYAAYGDATWRFAPQWELTFGLRYTQDEKDHFVDSQGPQPPVSVLGTPIPGFVYRDAPYAANEESWDAWTPRVVLNYHLDEDTMIYASASQGYKSGGFNSFLPNNPFDPEYVDSYEIGNKASLFDNTLRINSAIFYYDYTDLQVNNIEDTLVILRNAGEAEGKGAEVDFEWLFTDGWQLSGNVGYLDAKFVEFDPVIGDQVEPDGTPIPTDLGGETMPLAPRWSASLILQHFQTLNSGAEIEYRLSYAWTDSYYFEIGNTKEDPDEYQDAYGLIDARISFTTADSHWRTALFGNNLADEQYLIYAGGLAKYKLDAPITTAAIGRTWGASLEYLF